MTFCNSRLAKSHAAQKGKVPSSRKYTGRFYRNIIFNNLIEGIENNMGYIVRKMTKRQAEDISTWKYDEPYSIYDMDGSKEILDELLDGSYYAVTNEKDELTGYFCFGDAAQVPGGKQCGAYLEDDAIDIGLGMRSDLIGKGMGLNF
ncbi:MAG: hypothetical protein KAX30_09465, partial [Candidatus Atribacteria bacterium]|nr:hypothetical protein [Candidatus Atribacteria bacterium]